MFLALRKFLVIFLAILQLIAPLVHAHAGERMPDLGLHVPGLEMYGAKQDVLMSEAVNHDFNSEGIIVGVDAGMRDRQANAVVDVDNDHYLHQQNALFKTAVSPFDINFSPQSTQFVCRIFVPSLSPRAPPAQ
ncbi:MAG: hypothetical protein ACXV8O_15890 [Methylobacter sp.]